jgi:hypothetical protein
MVVVPRAGRGLRFCGLAYGIMVFIWLSPEDSLVGLPVALGVLGMLLLLMRWLLNRWGGQSLPLLLSGALMGVGVGAGAAPAAAALMFFKNALHAHEFPDYPLPLLLSVVGRTPAWALIGLLIGVGLALSVLAARSVRGEN